MKFDLKKYFLFKKNDRIGIISLFTLMMIFFIVDVSLPKLIKNEHHFEFEEFSAEVDSFMLSLSDDNSSNDIYYSRLDSFIIARYDTLDLFKFNPNKTTDEQWLKLGLTEKQIKTINNYIDRGGSFKIKSDFQKIYGIRTMQYNILKPYIDLPDELQNSSQSSYQSDNNQNTQSCTLFEFDPNTATDDDFRKLGLSDKQITTVNNYRKSGGNFKKKEDFKKVYVISDYDYNRLEQYIVIDNAQTTDAQPVVKTIPNVEVNSADTALLKQLPGIGTVISGRIVKFRNKLGGFYKIEQLKEVYGLSAQTFSQIQQYLQINTTNITKIDINFAEYADLVKHPYINSAIANKILNYKKRNGFYTSVDQLINNNVLSQDEYDKLKNYLIVK